MKFKNGKHYTRMTYRTDEACEFLSINYSTLKKYREMLGIEPRKLSGCLGRYYTWEELTRMLELHLPPVSCYARDLKTRLELLQKAGRL